MEIKNERLPRVDDPGDSALYIPIGSGAIHGSGDFRLEEGDQLELRYFKMRYTQNIIFVGMLDNNSYPGSTRSQWSVRFISPPHEE